MKKPTKEAAGRPEAIPFPDGLGVPLEEMIRQGAQRIVRQAVEAELAEALENYAQVTMIDGRQVVVRNGYQPERPILTAAGPVAVRVPKVRDRSQSGIKFNSKLVPPYVRRSARVSAALPWLYLKIGVQDRINLGTGKSMY